MSWTREKKLAVANRAAFAAVAIPAIIQLTLLAIAIASRFLYPYDLEWMEGGLLDHAARLQEGAGIYTPPSVEFIPYLYTPLYPGLLAFFGELFGISYTLGRAVSIVSLLVCFAVVVLSTQAPNARLRLRPALLGVLASGLIAAAYPWLEGWYDIVRGDTLFIAMVLLGLHLLSRWKDEGGRRGHARVATVAALLALSFFCKQIGVLFVIAGGINLLFFRRWRLFLTYVGVSGAIGIGGTLLLQAVSDGWFWTYVYEIHQAHDFNWDRFTVSFTNMLGRSIAATLIIGAAILAIGARLAARRPVPPEAGRFLFWLLPYAVATVAGALGWATQWAHFNAYMSQIFIGAVTVATGLVAIAALVRAWFSRAGAWLALALPIALAAELFSQRWKPAVFIPSQKDARAGARLIERIRAIDGEVMVPFHPWYARLAGKETTVHRMGVMDVRYGRKYRVEDLSEALRNKRFAAIIFDNRGLGSELGEIARSYRQDAVIPGAERPRVFTGNKVVPASVWIPIGPPPPPPAGARVLFEFDDLEDYAGWQVSGTAWGTRPRRYDQDKKKALGFTGIKYARSSSGGVRAEGAEGAEGELISPPFVIDGSRITGLVGGGQSPKLIAELRILGADGANAAVRTATGSGSEELVAIEWEVSAWRGKRATIALIDRDAGPRATLSADAFWIWEK